MYTTNIVHKSLLENGSDDTADFGDSDEEILHEIGEDTGSCIRIRIEIKGRERPFQRTNFAHAKIGEDDRQLYPDSKKVRPFSSQALIKEH